jgi:putative transposase
MTASECEFLPSAKTKGTDKVKNGKRHSQEEIIKILQEVENTGNAALVARDRGVSVQTIYRWRDRFGGMTKSELAELKALQAENARLKRIVATQAMDIDALKELQKGKW